MEVYKDIDHDSGVQGYEIGADFITVQFKGTARTYTYSYASAGEAYVERMKGLAAQGDGLNAYINTNVRNGYVK